MEVYDTPFPLLTAFSMFLLGIFMVELAFSVYLDPTYILQLKLEQTYETSDEFAQNYIARLVYLMFMSGVVGFAGIYWLFSLVEDKTNVF
uniref:Uncharacterized protein n=1 Tax=Paramoeba aestuarina TaxID=180227 RepID=A0A7S4L989_9EUKA